MTLSELIAAFRSETDDKVRAVNPGGTTNELLWSDLDITGFLNEAETEAAIRKRLIFDSFTAEVTEIDVVAGTSKYALDPRLFEVTAAYLYDATETRRQRLTPTDLPYLSEHSPYWRGDRSPPERIVIEDTYILLPNLITEPGLLRLEGYRTPMRPLTDENDTPEIAEVHHRFLLHWALHRAFKKKDVEVLDPTASATELAAFEAYFGYRLTANQGKRNQVDRPHHVKAYW